MRIPACSWMPCSLKRPIRIRKKPGLDEERVKQMMRLVEKRFGAERKNIDLIAKANQKCRDSKPIVILTDTAFFGL